MSRPWNPGQRSLKDIGTDPDRSTTYDFLLATMSRFQDKRRFQSKIAIFPHPVYFKAPLIGFPLELGTDARGQKTRMMELPDGLKSSKIGLAV